MRINKLILKNFIENHVKHYVVLIKNHYPRIYEFINNLEGDTFPEKCYRYIFQEEIEKNSLGICPISGKKTKFFRFTVGYRKYFSNVELSLDLNMISNRSEKAHQTFIKKYGVTCPSQLDSSKEKIREKRKNGSYDDAVLKQKQTLLKKYGNENYNNLELNKKTKKERYGN